MHLYLLIFLFFSKNSYSSDEVWKELPRQNLTFLKNGNVIFNQRKSFQTNENINNNDLLHVNNEPPTYTPTYLNSELEVNEIFNNLRNDYKRKSECSDRAHVWAYDAFKKRDLKSQKIFIFFTASYINRYHFKWWFHVAPLVSTKIKNEIQEYVLDFRYADRPLKLKEWTNLMVYSGRDCKITTKFSEYDVNPQTEDCYIIKESMFYRLPGEIFDQERKGIYREKFLEYEINFSIKSGFSRELSNAQ